MRRALWIALVLASADASGQTPVAVPFERTELSGAIAGRVCRDLDGDGLCGPDEPGVPGIRVVLETGEVALTDELGRYHLAAVPARTPDPGLRGRLLPGRHRVAVDDRELPSGSVVTPPRATVELPMGGLALQDFALRSETRHAEPVTSAYKPQAPAAVVEQGGAAVRFPLSGQAQPGDAVTVNGAPAEVDAQGRYRAWVELKVGGNDVAIVATSPDGQVRIFSQQVDVVSRPGEGLLVLPRPLMAAAQVALPAGKGEAVAAGPARLRIEGAPGTTISHPGGKVTVGPDGAAELPLELRAGSNEVPISVQPPGQPARQDRLEIVAVPRPFVVGLVDLEGTLDPATGGLRLFGRGAAHGELRMGGGWNIAGELELRDQDLQTLKVGGYPALLVPRSPEQLERALDPDALPTEWGDRSTTVHPNAAEGILRVEARHDEYGRLGIGTYRAALEDTEFGRFHRELFGPYADLKMPVGPARVDVVGFAAAGAVDPLRGLATAPGHDELTATGGSLYYLGSGGLAAGSESVKVELRDGITGVPLAERHLVRGRDYEIDWSAGRILLARPLSFVDGVSVLRSEPLAASPTPVLVVDYERLLLGVTPTATQGGEARVTWGPVQLAAGAAQEQAGVALYRLYKAQGSVALGPVSLHAEAAQSEGQLMTSSAFGLSDDGGLTFLRPGPASLSGGQALSVRLRGPGVSPEGHVDASFRWHSAGFTDSAHAEGALLRQLSLRAEQPFGPFVIGLLGDSRVAPDPREPFSGRSIGSRTLGLSLGYANPTFEVRAEVKDAELTASADPEIDDPKTGGRFSAGVSARYRLLPWLAIAAGHKQVLAVRGEGPGAIADTFTQVGADVALGQAGEVGARVGYGPVTGPQAWLQGNYQRGDDAFYGSYSVDVDGPDFGQARAVSGARTRIGDTSAVFVEDVAAHDSTAIRLSRAVGFSGELAPGFQVSARYEHGTGQLLDLPSPLVRDAGGVTASYLSERLRLFGRAELRVDSGRTPRGPSVPVDRRQRVLSAGAELDLSENLRASGRFNFSDTVNLGVIEAHLLEGTGSLAWRAGWGMAVLRYSLLRELPPAAQAAFGERTYHTVSLLPAVKVGARVTVAAGAHAGWAGEAGAQGLVLSGSLRPAVRLVGGLEVAVEAARRTSAPDGGELSALRGEVGYRFDDRLLVAAGYTVFGFSGLGVTGADTGRQDRIYLRAELAY